MIFGQPLVIRRAPTAGKAGTFSGLASTWSVDRHGTVFARGAFRRSIEALAAGALRIPVLYEHNPLEQLGSITEAAETDDGLQVTGQIITGTPVADRVYQLALADAMGLSTGCLPRADGIEIDAEGHVVYTDVDLVEISAVSVSSNRESFIHTARHLGNVAPADFERMLHHGTLPPLPRRLAAKLTRAALPVIGDGFEPEETDHDSAELAALIAAVNGLRSTFTT